MSGRSRLFVSAESIPGRYNAVTLRAYLGGDAVVKEGEHAGKYGFIIDTASPDAIREKIESLRPTRAPREHDNGRRQIGRSYSQGATDTYSSMSPLQASSPQVAINSNSSYAYGLPESSMSSTYGMSPRTSSSYYGAGMDYLSRQSSRGDAGMDSLSRQSSRSDAYEPYPVSDRRPSIYASSAAGTQPIPIPSQRRPSTFSDASENSFDSLYGFKYRPASPRGGHHSSNNVCGRR